MKQFLIYLKGEEKPVVVSEVRGRIVDKTWKDPAFPKDTQIEMGEQGTITKNEIRKIMSETIRPVIAEIEKPLSPQAKKNLDNKIKEVGAELRAKGIVKTK